MTAAPMTATLDATLSGPTSNSYITLAEATAIAQNLPFGPEWNTTSDNDLALALTTATRWLETLDYGGTRCKNTQRLKWPRVGATSDGVTSDCVGIPYRIQEAEVILAWAWIKSPNQFPGAGGGNTAPTGTYVKRQKLDVLEIEYDEFSNPESSSCDSCGDPAIIQAFPWLVDLLGCWAAGISTGSSKMVRLFRN